MAIKIIRKECEIPGFKKMYLNGRASQNIKSAKQLSQIVFISEQVRQLLTATKNS